jgi:hypothetical protein
MKFGRKIKIRFINIVKELDAEIDGCGKRISSGPKVL